MTDDVPVIPLANAPGAREAWDRPRWVVYLWAVAEVLILVNPLQPSSQLRSLALRAFGAHIGEGVILRPRLRVKFPWKLTVGDSSWIGEDVWIHNQDQLSIGQDCVLSQGTFVTTGSHRFRSDMSLTTTPVVIEDGVWLTARCVVLRGSRIGRSALVLPGTLVQGSVPAGAIFAGSPGTVTGQRFESVPTS